MLKSYILALSALIYSSNAYAASGACKVAPLIGPCFVLKGRIAFTADSGPVLDTKNRRFYFGQRGDFIPERILQVLRKDMAAAVDGTYRVCPTPDGENQFGRTHTLCIDSASHLSILRPKQR
jgi:hypothetical protein